MLIALPVLIPMLGAALCLLFWGRSRPQAILALASTATIGGKLEPSAPSNRIWYSR